MNTRVLVVDDASLFRRVVSDALSGLPGVEVVGSAMNGRAALAKISTLQPDVMTLDIEMPEMNGIEVLDAIRSAGLHTKVIMLSAYTKRGSEMTIRALEHGALDFVTKPEAGGQEESLQLLRDSLRPILQAIGRRREIAATGQANTVATPAGPGRRLRSASPIVVIGVSTGGPTALAELLPALPAKIGAPVFIVQHMPPMFTAALADRLRSKSAIHVKEAVDGEVADSDCVYIAPGGRQMKLAQGPKGEILIQLTDDPPENACRPSVDYLFRSAALQFPGRSIGVILTGMGNDGTAGMRLLKRGGSLTIAQDEGSCVVYGMPREAVAAGVVDTVVPLKKIAETILHAIAEARS